jgi:HEAT repeat protein
VAEIVIRTTPEALAFVAREWLPVGIVYIRTDEGAELGTWRRVTLMLPDGREVPLVGNVAEVTQDARGFRLGVRLSGDNTVALETIRRAAGVGVITLADDVPYEPTAIRDGSAPSSTPGPDPRSEPPAVVPEPGHSSPAPFDLSDPIEIIRDAEDLVVSPPPTEFVALSKSKTEELLLSPATPVPVVRAQRAHSPPAMPPPAPSRPSPPAAVRPPPPPRSAPLPAPVAPPPPPRSRAAIPAAPVAQGGRRDSTSGLLRHSRMLADQFRAAMGEVQAMGLSDERRRTAVLRRAVDLIRPVEKPELLSDLLLRTIVLLPAESGAERQALERDLLQMLPPGPMIRACTFLARQAHLLATVGGPQAEGHLDAATRVVALVASAHLRKLDADTVELLRALEDQGTVLLRRAPAEVREWVAAARYLRGSRAEAESAAGALDDVRTQERYTQELESLERAAQLLRQERRWGPLGPLIQVLGRHRDDPSAPFEERTWLASSALDRFFGGNGVQELVRTFSEASPDVREELGRILAVEGDRAPILVLEILKRSSDAGMRRASVALLKKSAETTRRGVLASLGDPNLEWFVVCNLLVILGEVGREGDLPVITRFREHAHDQVRRAALEAMAALGGKRAEGPLTRALDDRSRIVQSRALVLLGQIGSTSSVTLGYIHDLLRDREAPDEDEDLVCAAIEALARIGNVPMPGSAGSVEEVLVKTLESTRRSGLAKMLHGTAGGLWSRPPVRRALASALARVGLDKAEEILKKIAYDDGDPIRTDAEQAIFQIAARRKAEADGS